MAEKIFYALDTDTAFRTDQSEIANTNLSECIYKQQNKDLDIQLLNSESVDSNGDFDDFYTGFATKTVSASAAVDNNWNHTAAAKVNTALTIGVGVASVDIKEVSSDFDAERPVGTVNFADGESVNYNKVTAITGGYTLRTADASFVTANFVPAASHAVDEELLCVELPIIKDATVGVTDKDTGLLNVSFDCFNVIYQSLVEDSSEIDGCIFEIQVFEGGVPIMVKQFDIALKGLLDDNGETAPAPLSGYWTAAESDSRFVRQALSTAYPAALSVVGTERFFFRDGSTSKQGTLQILKDYIVSSNDTGTIADAASIDYALFSVANFDTCEVIINIKDSTAGAFTQFKYTVYADPLTVADDGGTVLNFKGGGVSGMTITFSTTGSEASVNVLNNAGNSVEYSIKVINTTEFA